MDKYNEEFEKELFDLEINYTRGETLLLTEVESIFANTHYLEVFVRNELHHVNHDLIAGFRIFNKRKVDTETDESDESDKSDDSVESEFEGSDE